MIQANHDEGLLLGQRVDSSLDIPMVAQVLRIAAYDELHALAFYRRVVEQFGPVAPFVQIVEAEQRHYQMVWGLLERYRIMAPVDSWHQYVTIPGTLVECCEMGVAAEIDNVALYEHLLRQVDQKDIRELFYRLQAASHNHHLPALRNGIRHYQGGATAEVDLKEIYQRHGRHQLEEIFDKVERYRPLLESIKTGQVDPEALEKVLQESNLALIGGVVLGGVAMMTWNIMQKEKE